MKFVYVKLYFGLKCGTLFLEDKTKKGERMSGQRVKDVRLEIRARNNLVLRRMEERGILSVAELCCRMKPYGNPSEVGKIINMKLSPLQKDSDAVVLKWRVSVERIAIVLECSPEDLFSEEQLESVLEDNRRMLEISIDDIRQLESASEYGSLVVDIDEDLRRKDLFRVLFEQIETLDKRERQVLKLRYGLGECIEHTLEEVGEILGCSGQYVSHLESKALLKMRHPRRATLLCNAGVFELL
jgi:RNA polymerase sigma factor (sigma-70 family)